MCTIEVFCGRPQFPTPKDLYVLYGGSLGSKADLSERQIHLSDRKIDRSEREIGADLSERIFRTERSIFRSERSERIFRNGSFGPKDRSFGEKDPSFGPKDQTIFKDASFQIDSSYLSPPKDRDRHIVSSGPDR